MTTYTMLAIAELREENDKLKMDLETVQRELETYKFKEQEEGGYIYFNGIDNCKKCKGWDGQDDRCECGNQRVSWTYDEEWPQYPIARSH